MNNTMLRAFPGRLLLAISLAVAGCGGNREKVTAPLQVPTAQANSRTGTASPGREVKDYLLKGVIKRVEKEVEHVRIAHEAIPGFMDAMTMRFAYKDKNLLEALRPGDRVQGTLRVEKSGGVVQGYELVGLAMTQAAPIVPAPDISRNKAPTGELPRRLEIGEVVPDFAMTTQDGKLERLSDLRGNVVVLTFIYTRCPLPDFCPLMDRKFSELAQRLIAFPERARLTRLISLSFDPDHDTPELLRKHAQFRGATPPLWKYAVASHAELAKVGAGLGLYYQPGDTEIAHNLCTAIIDTKGNLARLDVGTKSNRWETSDFLKMIYSLMPVAQK
jgi:protein SCO1/2